MLISTNVPRSAAADNLALLREEVGELVALGRELEQKLDVALAALEPPPSLPKLLRMPAGPMAATLWKVLGGRKALVLRTRLSQIAEADDGRRQPRGGGRNRVVRPVRTHPRPDRLDRPDPEGRGRGGNAVH